MVEPIKPDEVVEQKQKLFPDEVMEAFNELIAENYQNGSATFQQNEVVKRIVEKKGCESAEIFKNHWLDVEDVYRNAGWKVEYDKPAYNESYAATFTFRKK